MHYLIVAFLIVRYLIVALTWLGAHRKNAAGTLFG